MIGEWEASILSAKSPGSSWYRDGKATKSFGVPSIVFTFPSLPVSILGSHRCCVLSKRDRLSVTGWYR
jgi:hypothetical protein